MKKVLLVLGLGLVMFSCEKEDVKVNEGCNCGMIVSDDVTNYSVTIRNACTDNYKTFTLYEGDWFNAHPGSNYCITNEKGW